MKNFVDTYEVLFDDKFKPLFGRIDFCEANTTTPKAVYSIDGVSLGSTVYINGKSSVQIMLDDSDYTAYYYRYIGDSDMTVDDNEESWLHFKTALIKEQNINITYDLPFRTVNTIDELRALEDMSNGDLVYVFGYEEKGDIAPRIFKWIENSPGSTDDGGYYIKSNSITSGVWIWIVEGDLIDVRYFGAFPNSTSTDTNCQLGKIANATHIANQLNKNLYFSSCSNGATGYYLFDGSNTLSLEKDIICDEVRFVVKEGTTGTSISCHELHKCTPRLFTKAGSESDPSVHIGNYTLKCDWSNASWFYGYSPANARIGYIIDQENVPGNYSNTNIKLIGQRRLVSGTHIYTGTTFSNCKFLETTYGIDNNVIFNNMEIKQEWFDLDYDFDDLTLGTNVELFVDNFTSVDLYLKLKQRANQYDFGDLKERTISSNLTLGASNENCIMENFNIQNGNSISIIGHWELHNATGTITVDSNTTLNAIDCWLNTTSTVMDSLEMRRGALSGADSLQLLSVGYFDNVDINKDIRTLGITPTYKHCKINAALTTQNCIIHDCDIYQPIYTRNDFNVIDFSLIGNRFHTGSMHYISSTISNTHVDGKWIDNFSELSTHFISLDRTNLNPYEKNHHYVYDGNTGTNTLQKNPIWKDTLHYNANYKGIHSWYCPYHFIHDYYSTSTGEMPEAVISTCYYKATNNDDTDPTYYSTEFEMFSIGTDMDSIVMTLYSEPDTKLIYGSTIEPERITNRYLPTGMINSLSDKEINTTSSVTMAKSLMLVGDYTWKIGGGIIIGKVQGLTVANASILGDLNINFEIHRI